MSDSKINVLDIVRGTTVDGPGFRTSIYLAGCKHKCPGCHNPQSWDFHAGMPYTINQLMEIIREEDFDVTLSGGDPLYHPEFITALAREIAQEGHSLWIYTGFVWEDVRDLPQFRELWTLTETLVDGPFIEALRDSDLLFRGSSNQRFIHPHEAFRDND